MTRSKVLRTAAVRGFASLLCVITVLGTSRSYAAPADVFSSPAPVIGSDPPKAAALNDGEASVSTQTGALTFSYPITVPPGRGGMQPHLALSYSSQAPIYGTIAAGWSLSLPAILYDRGDGWLRTHSPQVESTQTPSQQIADDRYISTMAGNRPLVEVDEPRGSGTTAFRAQNDASYTRYERMPLGSGFLWRAYTTSGVVMTFGEDDRAQCAGVDYGFAPLTGEVDAFGNEVSYFYGAVSTGDDAEDCVLKEVRWGQNSTAQLGTFAKLVFGWTNSSSVSLPGGPYYTGAIRDYGTGKRVIRGTGRLNTIVATAFAPGSESSPVHTRTITLSYEAAAEESTGDIKHAPLRLLTSIQETAVGTVPTLAVTSPPVEFTYGPATSLSTMDSRTTSVPWANAAEEAKENLGWGYGRITSDDRWPSVEAMMIDIDGDGLLDRVTNYAIGSDGTTKVEEFGMLDCGAWWQRNEGIDLESGAIRFAAAVPLTFVDQPNAQVLPRLKWGDGITAGGSSSVASGRQTCSLNGQATSYFNSHALPNVCHVYDHDLNQEKPCENAGGHIQQYCYPGGTRCPLDPGSGGGGAGSYLTYLAYRWLDIDGDGITDLVAAIHGDTDTYDPEFGNNSLEGWWDCQDGHCDPTIYEDAPFHLDGWPACPGSMEICKHVGTCVEERSASCTGPVCSPDWAAVSECWDSADYDECFTLSGHSTSVEPEDPSLRTPYSRCEGLYPWFIFKGKGNGTFEGIPTVKYQPIPLESEQADSSLVGPTVMAENHAIMDFDGDGFLDGIVHAKLDDTNAPPAADNWFVWLGDGTGGMGPKAYYFGTRTEALGQNRISAAESNLDLRGQVEGTLDLNGDGLPEQWADHDGTANIAFNAATSFEVNASKQGLVDTATDFKPAQMMEIGATFTSPPDRPYAESNATNRPVDVDGDGRVDIVRWESGVPMVRYNVGGQFLVSGADYPGANTVDVAVGRRIRVTGGEHDAPIIWEVKSDLLDIDGDGIAEANFASGSSFQRELPSSLDPPRLITKIDNHRGATTFVSYASLHDPTAVVQTPDETWFDGRPKSTPVEQWVVKSIRSEDAFDAFPDGTGTVTSYSYRNPRHSPDDQGHYAFRGFESVVTTSQSGARTEQTYGYDVDWSGRLVKSATFSAEHPQHPETIDTTTYSDLRGLFGGDIIVFAPLLTTHSLCAGIQTETECTPTAAAAYTEVLSTYSTLRTAAAPDLPLLYVETSTRSQHGTGEATGDRLATHTFVLRSDQHEYRLRPAETDLAAQDVDGAMVNYAKSRTTWNTEEPAVNSRKLTEEVAVDDDHWSVTSFAYDSHTGNLLSRTTPRGNTTTYEYEEPRKLFPTAEDIQYYPKNYEFEYDFGTGTKTVTKGPNIAWCQQASPPYCPPNTITKQETTTVIDGLGRPVLRKESASVTDDAYFEPRDVEKFEYQDASLPGSPSLVRHFTAIGGTPASTRYAEDDTRLDGHGRPITKSVLGGSAPAVTTFNYGLDGTVASVSVPDPRATDGSTLTYTYSFDSLGRPTSMRRPDPALSLETGADMEYDGLVTTVREVTGGSGTPAETRRTVDNEGRLVKVEEKSSIAPLAYATTLYEYGPDNQVSKITDPDGAVTELFHDFAGHRTKITRGTRSWEYQYDLDGNVVAETTPCEPQPDCRAAYTTITQYDFLDRPYVRYLAPRELTDEDLDLFGASREDLIWDYGSNARGRLSQWVTYGPSNVENQFEWLMYDPEGRLVEDWQRFSGAGYASLTRDSLYSYLIGGLPNLTLYREYAGGGDFTVSQLEYDDRGQPSNIWISTDRGINWQAPIADTRNVAGLVTKRRVDLDGPMTYLESNWTYDHLGRVTDQTVLQGPGQTQTTRQQLSYLGNDDVDSLTTYFGNTGEQQSFSYDPRHQLIGVTSATSGRFAADYHYTSAGRFAHAVEEQATPVPSGTEVIPRDVFYHYEGGDPDEVTSLTSGSDIGPLFTTYTYDLAGNQVTRNDAATGDSWEYLYDGKDQLRRATKKHSGAIVGVEEYWYGSNGARTHVVKRDASNTVTEMIWYHGDAESHFDSTGNVTVAYADIGGVARVTRNKDATTTTEYQFHGLAGSTLAAIESDGRLNAAFDYAPFGEVIASDGSTSGLDSHKRRHNDKVVDDLTGLAYYGSRYYDRTLLNWSQLDPLYLRIPDLTTQSTPRRSNLGVFSLNNPVRFFDPDGRDSVARPRPWTDEFSDAQRSRIAQAGGDDSTATMDAHAVQTWNRWNFWDGTSGEGGGLNSDNACDGVHGVCETPEEIVARGTADALAAGMAAYDPRVRDTQEAHPFLDAIGRDVVAGVVAYWCPSCAVAIAFSGARNEGEAAAAGFGWGIGKIFGSVRSATKAAEAVTTKGGYSILDGVRRAKAAEIAGHASLDAEIINAGGATVGRARIPLGDLWSPKSAIDTSGAGLSRWNSTLGKTLSGSQAPPILVTPGVQAGYTWLPHVGIE